jgi:predicted transcriptional regulator of viral defense system
VGSEQDVVRRTVNPRLFAVQPPVLRPQDAAWWANPQKELAKLARAGVIITPLRGHYVVPPPDRISDPTWRPTLEGFALALGQRVTGAENAALMGVSAARIHGALPRAVATAVVALAKQRRHSMERTTWGDVFWVRRHIDDLDVQRTTTDLTTGWVTTVEQTVLDIADRPERGRVDAQTASEIIVALAPRADWDLVADLAAAQRRRSAFARARWVADAVLEPTAAAPTPPQHRDRYADPKGLRSATPVDAEQFGVAVPAEQG